MRDFFYSPTTFNLREQQFVYDSVLDFYKDANIACPAPPPSAQQLANEANMGRCASVHIEPLLCKRVFITNVKGTFFGMSESEEASKRR